MALDWTSYNLKLLRSGDPRWPAGRRQGPDWFLSRVRAYDMWFIRRGRGFLRAPDSTCKLRAGVVTWFRSGVGYEVTQDEKAPLSMFFVHFDLRDGLGENPIPEMLPRAFHRVEEKEYFAMVMGRVVDLLKALTGNNLSADEEQNSFLEATHLFWGLLVDYDRQAPSGRNAGSAHPGPVRPKNRISAAIREVVAHPQEAAAQNVAGLAARYGYSAKHFTRAFIKARKLAPKQFLLDTRFGEAKKLLEESDLGIEQIAGALGYKTLSSFSQQFKKRTGLSPLAFRKRQGQGADTPMKPGGPR